MHGVRFATVRDLYEAFPAARQDVGSEPSGTDSLLFLRDLVAKGGLAQAAVYCVYLLPRREAVWWGCETLRRLIPDQASKDQEALEAAEAWVFKPEEECRIEALEIGTRGDGRSPATWMALAAGWSGGNVVASEVGTAPAPADQTARALRAGLLIALAKAPRENLGEILRACLQDGIGLAIGDRVLEDPIE